MMSSNGTTRTWNCQVPRVTTRFRVLLLGFVSIFIFQVHTVSAQNYIPNVQGRLCPEGTNVTGQFSVTGTAQRLAEPDMGVVTFRVFATEDTLAGASNEGNTVSNGIMGALMDLAFLNDTDITTTAFLVQPNYEDTRNTAVSNYTYSQSMTVRSASGNVSDVIDAVIGAGGNNVEITDTQFYVSDGLLREIQNALREEAVNHAATTAATLAKSIGAALGAVTYITDSFYAPYQPYAAMAANDVGLSPEKTTVVSSGTQKVEGSIGLTYEICA
mmetsp:Transcript_13301/g.26514  ORF Transcript_13301/g.26514 Transcript_13301/m.26514 type:complete len:272 (+) Transcript_13301:1645-2460(+)